MLEKLFELEKELTESKFYGTLTIKWEAGRVVIVKKEESIKLS